MLAKYYKAIIAFVGVLGTAIAATAADPTITGVLPPGWTGGVIVAGSVISGLLAALVRNQKTVDQVDAALLAGDFTVRDLEALIAKHKSA